MKLIQANIWGGRLDKQIPAFLNKQDADVVCLQEVIAAEGDTALAISLENIAAETKISHVFHSPVFSFNLMNKVAHFGNAILSHQPFVFTDTIFTNLEYKANFDFDTDDYNIRNLQHAVLKVSGKQLHILNHHGHHVHAHKNGDAETLRQMQQIRAYLSTLSGPIILAGDFNLAPHSESLEVLNEQLENLSITYKLKTTRNMLTLKTEVCDYIFVSKDIHVKSFSTSDEIISDHKALLLEFEL